MVQALAPTLVPRLRRNLQHGQKALLRSLVLAAILAAGAGLLLTSVVLGLSVWLGPIAATGLVGLALLLAGALGAAVLRRRPKPLPAPMPVLAPGVWQPEMLLPGLGFVFGLVLTRTLMRKIASARRP
jgi:hypothetical protein